MRKFYSRLMLAVMALMMCGAAMAQGESSPLRYKAINDDECKVIKYKDSEHKYYGDIVIPAEYKAPDDAITRKVVEIDENAFVYCDKVTSVTMPNTIRVIGDDAFSGTSIKTVVIPASVDSIGYRAFTYMDNLIFEDGPTPIHFTREGKGRSIYTDSLRTVYCGRPMSDNKFQVRTKNLHTITFGPAVTRIPDSFAHSCGNLVKINWGGNEAVIGSSAFQNCYHLPEVILPESLIELGSTAFWFCEELENVKLNSNLKVIGNDALAHTAIKNITIPASVDSIGSRAFSTNIEHLRIEDGPTPIRYNSSNYIFTNDSLRTVYCGRPMPNDVFHLRSAKKLHTISFGPAVTSIPEDFAKNDTSLVNINWGGNETVIGSSAFQNCYHLKTVTFPENLTEICSTAFWYCEDLETVKFNDNLKIIGNDAFANTAIKNLTIPASVDSIGTRTFSSNIEHLRFEDGPTPIHYNDRNYNFNLDSLRTLYCGRPMPDTNFRPKRSGKLWKVSFGAYVSEISEDFAYYAKSLTAIECLGSVPPVVNKNAFRVDSSDSGYRIYDHATLYVNEPDIETYKSADFWSGFYKIGIYDSIDGITADHRFNGQTLNLLGQPVGADYKGIVIENGRKVMRR